MRIGVPRQSQSRERRVGVTPNGVSKLVADGHEVFIEVGAGLKAGFPDVDYREAGGTVEQRGFVIGHHGLVVQTLGPAIDELSQPDWSRLGSKHTLIALLDPLWDPGRTEALAATGSTVLSLELIPRITRAQSMDVLSSMATVSGYQAVLLAASRAPRMFPMLMTAAGTVPPAKVLILGAGVAGLQAIATARRLGAVVEAYDIRPAATEQIESVGAKAIMLDLDTGQSEGAGGYAKVQSDELVRRQNEALLPFVANADVVISTAAIPGAASPELITTEMVEAMRSGSVIVDLAAERGGNCRLTDADGEVGHEGVLLLGPTDLPSRAAATSSLMFSNNVVTLIRHLTDDDGELHIDHDDQIARDTVVGFGGEVVHGAVRTKLGLAPLAEDDRSEKLDAEDTDEDKDAEHEGDDGKSAEDGDGSTDDLRHNVSAGLNTYLTTETTEGDEEE